MHDKTESSFVKSRRAYISRRYAIGGVAAGISAVLTWPLSRLSAGKQGVSQALSLQFATPQTTLDPNANQNVIDTTPVPANSPIDVNPPEVADPEGGGVFVDPPTGDGNQGILGDRLNPGMALIPTTQIRAENGPFYLYLGDDGRLNLRAFWGERRWWQYGDIATAIMQEDGNFVLYDSNNNPVWASNTGDNPGAILRMRDDGNLVVVHPNIGILWESGTSLNLEDPAFELARRIVRWQLGDDELLANRVELEYDRLDLEILYDSLEPSTTQVLRLDSAGYNNCSATEVARTFTFSTTTKDSLNWKNTTKQNFGIKFKLDLPLGIIPDPAEVSLSYETTSESGGSYEETRMRSNEIDVTVLPQTDVELEWTLESVVYDSPFVSRIVPIGARITTHFDGIVDIVTGRYQVDDFLTVEQKTLFGFGLFTAVVGSREEISHSESPAVCS
jgi:hypothetical protein